VNSDCPQPTGPGVGVCSSAGGTCSITCNPGYKQCGTACIPAAACCVDDDCPDDGPNHKHGVCAAGVCTQACDAGYPKTCGPACIPQGQCCTSAECTTPPNGCYIAAGTCANGACSYAFNNGAACNADNTKCTPNDRCMNGTCVADTANAVKCVKRECHSAPTCNPSTGNCEDSVTTGACGGNSCTGPGTCSGGVCSGVTKDCSALDGPCTSGLCDPLAIDPGKNCTPVNVANGTPCAAADKCLLQTACSGGVCLGTPKVCESSDPCRAAACDPATGACVEHQVPAGTACSMVDPGACAATSTCDAEGRCVPSSVPDGTPCTVEDCVAAAVCVTGACVCGGSVDLGTGADLGEGGAAGGEGCAMAAAPLARTAPLVLLFLMAAVARVARRRRR
jgi:hypothetical protein